MKWVKDGGKMTLKYVPLEAKMEVKKPAKKEAPKVKPAKVEVENEG